MEKMTEEELASTRRRIVVVGESREITELFENQGYEVLRMQEIPEILQREYYEGLCIQKQKEAYAKAYGVSIKDLVAVPYPLKRKGKPVSPAKSQKKPRNAKCACGSGKKNKKCCNF